MGKASKNSRLLALCVGTSLSALLAVAPASAQTSGDEGGRQDRSEASESDAIVVTGSRIQQQGFTAPTPVTAITPEQMLRTAPSNIPDALNQLPQFQGSISQNLQADTGSSVVRSGNYLDLRALGPQRVLILLNGRRVPPTSNSGATDSNLIPQMLVGRVDVVTGGASAAYGSDAVSGVVNYVLDERFEGFKLQAQGGISNHDDNASYRFGLAYGGSMLNDRLRVLLSAEAYHSDGIDDRASRYTDTGENSETSLTTGGFGTAANPYRYVANVNGNTASLYGLIRSGPLAGRQFTADGSALVPFDAGVPVPGRPGSFVGGGPGSVAPVEARGLTGVPSLSTEQLFGRVAYDLTDAVTFFAEGSYNTGSNEDTNSSFGLAAGGVTIFAENAFLSPAVASQMAPGSSFLLGRVYLDPRGPLNRAEQRNENVVVNVGFEGELGAGYTWSAYYTHGNAEFNSQAQQTENPRGFAAIDAVRDASGNIVCNITITNPGLMDDCVPLNPFGGLPSQAAIDYIRRDSHWRAVNKMDLVAANISGEPFSLWAGPVAIAVGAEYRRQTFEQTSNSDPAVPVSFVGIRGVNATNRFGGVNVGTGKGEYNISEVYGEVAVPIARESRIGDLDLNGAVRYTDYSTSGSVTTWKVGASYEPIEDIRLRGTVSQDIRAPSLFELFAGLQQTTSPLSDLHTGVSGVTNFRTSGNPDLEPEKARTYTVGAIFSPRFLSDFDLSLDYYDIEIENAISRPFSAPQIVDLCELSGGTSELCALVIRPFGFDNRTPENYPTEVRVQSLNLATVRTSGFDLEARYRMNVGPGTLGVRALASRLLHFEQQNSSLSPKREFAGNADYVQGFYPLPMPEWRGNLELSYEQGGLLVSLQERYVGSYNISDQFVYEDNKRDAVFYTDLHARYRFEDTVGSPEVFMTVNNAFDQRGRLFLISNVAGLNMPTSRNIYDVVGRYVTVGVRLRM